LRLTPSDIPNLAVEAAPPDVHVVDARATTPRSRLESPALSTRETLMTAIVVDVLIGAFTTVVAALLLEALRRADRRLRT